MERLELTREEYGFLNLLSLGLLKPLEGFMKSNEKDKLPVPVLLSRKGKEVSGRVELVYGGEVVGTMEVEDVFEDYVGGRVEGKKEGFDYKDHFVYFTPGPIYRWDEHVIRTLLEVYDKALICLFKEAEGEALSYAVRKRAVEAFINAYLPKERVSILELDFFYRDDYKALLPVIVKNLGCSALSMIVDETTSIPSEGITLHLFERPFFCSRCKGMATNRTCSHQDRFRVYPDVERLRTLLRRGTRLPEEYARPEVGKVLMEGFLFSSSKEEEKIKKSLKGLGYL